MVVLNLVQGTVLVVGATIVVLVERSFVSLMLLVAQLVLVVIVFKIVAFNAGIMVILLIMEVVVVDLFNLDI